MIDFSKWKSQWNEYVPAGTRVHGTPAATCYNTGIVFIIIGCIALGGILAYYVGYWKMPGRIFIAAVPFILGFGLMIASCSMPSHTPHTSEPPALNERIVQVWGLDDLDGCRKTKMNDLADMLKGRGLPDSGLRDGDWKCVAYRDGRRFDATVHVKDHRVGLYTPDGRELKPAGKDK